MTDIYETFRTRVAEEPTRTFLRTPTETKTYAEIDQAVDRYATALAARNISDDDVIGLYSENRPEFLFTLFGALRQGIRVACINTEMRGEGLEHLIEKAELTAIVATKNGLDRVETQIEKDSPQLLDLAVDSPYATLLGEDYSTTPPKRPQISNRDPAVLLHTSGTTGYPKWCELSHMYLTSLGSYVSDQFEISRSDTVFTPLPLFHINPLGYGCFGALCSGATLAFVPQFSASQFWEQATDLAATVAILHMAPKNMVLEKTTPADAEDTPIRVLFPADRELLADYNIPKVLTGYGSTEAGGLTHTNKFTRIPDEIPESESLSQYAGYLRDSMSIRIVDEEMQEVPQGTQGQILVRPMEPGVVFTGYYNAAEKTVEAWDGLWFNTGDIGYIDSKGALHYVGRIEDTISNKGQFVNVDLVENVLESHKAVTQAVVVGVPDAVVGDRIKATLALETDISPEMVVADVAEDLPDYMVPEYVEAVDSFPRIPGTEKIDRTTLREAGIDNCHHVD